LKRFYKLILFWFLMMTLVAGSISLSWADRETPKPGAIWHEPAIGIAFVWVPGGCYEMGSPSGEAGRDPDESPVHEVCVDGFWMGKTEVTNAQYQGQSRHQ
jgi:formylglycine-generating enzyme required for sulfatase activity